MRPACRWLDDLSSAAREALDRIGALFGVPRRSARADIDKLIRRMEADAYERAELERRSRVPAAWPREMQTRLPPAPSRRAPWAASLRSFR